MKRADPIRADIERARRQLERGTDPARVLEELSRRLTNKLGFGAFADELPARELSRP